MLQKVTAKDLLIGDVVHFQGARHRIVTIDERKMQAGRIWYVVRTEWIDGTKRAGMFGPDMPHTFRGLADQTLMVERLPAQ